MPVILRRTRPKRGNSHATSTDDNNNRKAILQFLTSFAEATWLIILK